MRGLAIPNLAAVRWGGERALTLPALVRQKWISH